ncbi:MAG: HAMP domain-containing protein [Chloroflexi bacterium]|nr:HAMP domain-containing protein [Chloroflexota bacterium]
MRSITIKLIAAFVGIGLISILVIVLVARWNTNQEFEKFVSNRNEEEFAIRLTDYYRNHGSWDGLAEAFRQNDPFDPHALPSKDVFRFVLSDPSGLIIIGGPPHLQPGDRASQADLKNSVPLKVDDELVGYLVLGGVPFERNPLESAFIRQVNNTLIYSGLAAITLALVLGMVLSRTLTKPIRELTAATQAMSQGNLGLQVSVRSRDELGELAHAFNKMSADLAQSINARRQMTADIAHELRTPLSLILGHAEAVNDGVLPPSLENFEIIREEAGRLEHLVDDLRTLSLADTGELSIEKRPCDLKKLLQDISSVYQHRVQQKNVALELDVPSELPSVQADANRITQVVTNILDNALRYTPENSKVTLAAGEVKDAVRISIQDSGPGIKNGQDVNHIFDRFYRLDASRNRAEGGSGLGLAIAKSIVQAHGGQIWAESVEGQGLSVLIELPVTSC